MAKKFGKILLLTAAIGSAFGAAYYYLLKKDSANNTLEDDDFDDFSENTDAESENSRNYVPLNTESTSEEKSDEDKAFTPLAEQVEKVSEKAEETVEEFFDEDDPAEDDAPVKAD